MKPAPFAYAAPRDLEEALALLAQHRDSASVLAGGQSLVPMLNFRIARPELLVDLNGVHSLGEIAVEDDHVRLGALSRLAALERVPELPVPTHETLAQIAHPQIRNRTTVGGSLAHADPASELPALVVALGGTIALRSRDGERTVEAEEFFVGPFATARRSDEIVTDVTLPRAEGARGVFLEFARRRGDFAIAGVCVVVRDAAARIAVCGASPRPVRALAGEAAFAAGASAAEVGATSATNVEPWDDVHASADYRRHLVETLVRRAIEQVRAC